MNYLKGKVAYLCGTINASPTSGVKWREVLDPQLKSFGIQVLNPCDKSTAIASEIGEQKKFFQKTIEQENWAKVKEDFWPVVRYDLRCVDRSDFIVFNYEPTIPTIGSIHELVVANFEKKPILLKYDKKDLSKFNPWITTLVKTQHFFADWNDMIGYLEKVDEGLIDSSYWII